MGGIGRIAQPLVVALTAPLGSLHNGVAVLDADGIAQAMDSAGAAPKVPKLPLVVQSGGIENDVVE